MDRYRDVMKRNIIGLLLAVIFAISPLVMLISPIPAYAMTTTITVTGEGAVTTGTYSGVPADYTGMNLNDGQTSYLSGADPNPSYHTYSMSDVGTSVVITGVSVTGTVIATTVSSAKLVCRTGGVNYLSDITFGNGSNTYSTSTFNSLINKNPGTGNNWTPSEFNAAEFGFQTNAHNGSVYCSYLSIVVTYTATPTVTTQAISGNGYTNPNYYATLNGNITDTGGATTNYRGFVWSTSTHTDPGNVVPVSSAYSDNWTETGTFATGAFSHQITSFAGATTYYVRSVAHNSIGWAYGSEVSFATLSAPTISTSAASGISFTTARLNASVTSAGGQLADVRFAYDNVTRANFALYANTTAWVTDNFTDGDHPYVDITGLTGATTYYFRVQIRNDVASAEGSQLTFTTSNAVLAPTAFTAITNATTTSLSWVKGSGANMTLIRYKPGSYPTSNSDGTLGYLGTGQSQSITGLTPGTTYYFVAYGFTSPTYSSSTAQTLGTTTAFDSTPTSTSALVTPQADSTWTQTPSTTKTSTIPIAGGLIQGIADSYNQPLNMVWYFAWMLLAVGVGIGVYIKGNFNIILGVGSMLGVIGVGVWWYNIVAGGIVILLGIIAIGWSLVGLRRPGG